MRPNDSNERASSSGHGKKNVKKTARAEEKKQKNLESPPSLFRKPEDKENRGKTCKLNKNAKVMT